MISLAAAAADPALLGGTLTLRSRQAELLATLDGAERLHVWAIGRQSGKSTLGALAAVHNACLRPDLDAILPRGRTRYVLSAAPSEDQAREFVRLCAAIIDGSPLLAPLAEIKADRIDFTLASGARSAIRAMAANSRTVRGMSASLIVLDEFAHFQDTDGAASDERMYAALEPSTRVFGDLARTLILSTPYGEGGKFHELFIAAQSGLLPSARAEHAPVWAFDDSLGEAWRDAKRIELGEDTYRQEFGAEFVAGGGSFFDLRGVVFEDGPAAPEDGRRWVAGLDPAFHGDRFGVVLVGESVSERGVLLVGRVEAIDPGGRLLSLDLRRGREDRTLAKVAEIIAPYAPMIVTDQHQADAVSSYFGREGCTVRVVNLTGPLITAAFTSTRARLLDGSLRLWRHPLLIEELRRVRAKDTERIELSRFGGGHSDAASALSQAVYELRGVTDSPPGEPRAGGTPLSAGGVPAGFESAFGVRAGRPDVDSDGYSKTPPPGWGGGSIRTMDF